MMNPREKLRQYIKAARHPGKDQLIDYQRERLPETERAAVQAHVTQCGECQTELNDIRYFFEPTQAGTSAFDTDESRRRRDALWAHLRAEEPADVAPEVGERFPGRWATRGWYATWAASLAAIVAASGWLWSWQHTRGLQTHWQAQVQAARTTVATLQGENQQLRQQHEQTRQEMAHLSERIQGLLSPQLNIPIVVLTSEGSRSTPGPPSAALKAAPIPSEAPFVTLVLQARSAVAYSDYRLEMMDTSERVVWNASGLRRQGAVDGYTLILPTQGWPPGRYTLNVYGEANGRWTLVDAYRVHLAPTPKLGLSGSPMRKNAAQ